MSSPISSLLIRFGLTQYLPLSDLPEQSPTSKPPNPKGFLANERTFLSWLQFSLILGTLAVGLLNATDSYTGIWSAGAFGLVSVGLMIYAYTTFRWRALKLAKKELGYYDENLGPVVLLAAVLLAVGLNFWLKYAANLF